jgi:hypothetical protein
MRRQRRRRTTASWQAFLRHEFVLRPQPRPGSIGEEVAANSVRLAHEAREAERVWRRERRQRRRAWASCGAATIGGL